MDNRQQPPTPAPQEQSQAHEPKAQLPDPPPQKDSDASHEPKPIYQPIDSLFALASVIIGFLFAKALPVTQNALGAMLCLLSWYLLGAAFLLRKGLRPKKRTLIYAAVTFLLSFGMITGGNTAVRTLLFLGLLAAFLYWCYISAELDGGVLFASAPFAHLTEGILALPFSSLQHLCPALIAFRKKNENTQKALKTLGGIGVGLLIAVIPTAIVVLLLSYDQQFTDILKKLFSFSLDRVWKNIWQLALGFAFALLLFGTLFGVLLRAKRPENGAKGIFPANTHVVPKALLCAAATPLLAVYAIFFFSQWNYYVSAFTHRLPDGLTYAAYAREGFFQLCIVCALNAVLLLIFNLLIQQKEERDLIKMIYSVIISVFTLILIATAISKMVLYISFYGLTQKRVYASWLMLLLATLFLLAILSQIKKRFRLFRAAAFACLLFAALITLPDVDGMIASYNVDAYLSGKLTAVDVFSVDDYGASSVPALIKLEQALSGDEQKTDDTSLLLAQARNALTRIEAELDRQPDGLFSFNIPDARAKRLLGERLDQPN